MSEFRKLIRGSFYFMSLFVCEHQEQFEEWLSEKLKENHVSHLDKVFGVDDKE